MIKVVTLIRRLVAGPDGAPAGRLLGRCDEAALQTALSLRARGAALAVIAIGPSEREDAVLRHSLDSGAERAIRVYDDSLAGVDYHGIARVAAAATRKLGFDLVLCGDHSDDEGQGAVGPAVAEALDVAHLTSVLEVKLDEGAAVVTHRDATHLRTLRLPLPLVLAISRSPGESPGITLRDGAIESMTLDELGIAAPELKHRLRCVGLATPARAMGGATMVGGADDLIARLRDDRLIP